MGTRPHFFTLSLEATAIKASVGAPRGGRLNCFRSAANVRDDGKGAACPARALTLGRARCLFFVFAQFRQRRQVFERAGVAETLVAGSYLPEQAAHDFATASFRQYISKSQIVGTREGADFLDDVLLQLFAQPVVALAATLAGNEGNHRLTLHLVGPADHRRLGDHRMGDQRAFDLHRPQPVAGNVNYVIDAPHNPKITVLVAAGAIAGEVHAVDLAEILLLVTVGVAVDRAQHPRPGPLDDQKTTLVGTNGITVARHHVGRDTRQRTGGGSRFGGDRARHRRNHDAAGLGLPPGIDDWAAAAADSLVIPDPSLRIDRFADCSKQAQAREVVFSGPRVAPFYKCAYGGRRRVKDIHSVFLDYRPPAIFLGEIGRPLVHHNGGASSQWTVD